MKPPLTSVALVLVLAAGGTPAQAARRKADCLLIVNGRAYINGPCNYDPGTGGSFELGNYVVIHQGEDMAHTRGRGYFAQVDANADGTAEGFWNEDDGAGHAQSRLGTLHRAGACWQNEHAKICAWKLGERRYFTD
jgi:hypothetical protein